MTWKNKKKKGDVDAEPNRASSTGTPAACLFCKDMFSSKSRLFTHLRTPGTECNRKAVETGHLPPAAPITNRMALLIGYLKRGDETSAEEDWVESEVWRAVSLAVESTATDDDDSSDVDDDLPVVDGLSAEGRLPENACDHESKHLFPERSSEDLAARDVAQAILNASRPAAAPVAPSPTPTTPLCRFLEAGPLKKADNGDSGAARTPQQSPGLQSAAEGVVTKPAEDRARVANGSWVHTTAAPSQSELWGIKGFSRSSAVRRREGPFAQPPSVHAVTDVLTFHVDEVAEARLADPDAEHRRGQAQCARWLRAVRKALPWRVRAWGLTRTHLQFDAESHCNLRRYHYLLPIRTLLPEDDAHAVIHDEAKWEALTTKLKLVTRKFVGQGRWHNFYPGLVPHEAVAQLFVKQCSHYGQAVFSGVPYLCIAVLGDSFLTTQMQGLIGLLVAVVRGELPTDYIHLALSDDIVEVPMAPLAGLYLAECWFSVAETNHRILLRPRRTDRDIGVETDGGFSQAGLFAQLERWRTRVQACIAQREAAEGTMVTWAEKELPVQVPRLLEAMRRRERTYTAAVPRVRLGGAAGGEGGMEGAVGAAYARVLRLLREADRGGKWPQCSAGRREIISEQTMDQGGGSFSVGSMPPPLRVPAANELFPELMAAAFQLEAAIMPHREGSSTIAVNRRAQFRPHYDSGGGAGQSTSLIVGLGDYQGGELMVEGERHDIRYVPVEFNGWTQRHWTLPFAGERYSLVWFTPKGCENRRGLDLELCQPYLTGQ